ncbi:DNA cytosine methyltransferase [Burkholderia pseudomallei]|uniref:DNA cytosine methyltransferase n=1 Tax=Burkholderia pseudomallei TaxID=28450 RepID=UPI0009B2BD2B
MNELALFAGAGGGILGSHLLGWRTVCAVEYNAYARSVLLARQDDGTLAPFPIWDDVRTFDGRPWRGFIDVVSGGFPCQPFSTASRGRRVAEDRWPDMFRIITEVEPSGVLAENVQREPIERAASALRRIGYSTAIGKNCPSALGSAHRRPRWWLVANADGKGQSRLSVDAEMACLRPVPRLASWQNDPLALGMDDGVANRMDRLAALGNGQLPSMAARAWRHLGGVAGA